MIDPTRREFLHASAAAAVTSAMPALATATVQPDQADRVVAVSSGNGLRATARAAELMQRDSDTLDAVIAGVNIVEEDSDDMSVGYGGLPNEEGVVELDSCVMHGPTATAGAVAALQKVKTPSRIANLVRQRTDHVLIVGEGALRFARAHGFEEVNLLTDRARQAWLKWKETHSDRDDWIRPDKPIDGAEQSMLPGDVPFTYGTITCLGLNARGEISGVTTTSGLSYKIPGRVGDSPIIGSGLFVDNEVGAAGSTGRGEAVIQVCGAHTIVEAMRHGMSPAEACLHAAKRIADKTKLKRLLDDAGRPNFDVKFYALSKDGRFGGASIWSGANYAVHEAGRNRLEDCAFLFERRR